MIINEPRRKMKEVTRKEKQFNQEEIKNDNDADVLAFKVG